MDRPASNPIAETVRALAERVRQIEGTARGGPDNEALVSSGCAALDRLLPSGGLKRGTLVEWLSAGPGSGAATLALVAAWQAARAAGAIVVIDRRQWFYPLAAVGLGIELEKLIVVRATTEEDEAWALDQSLRCRGAAAVLGWPEKVDDHTFRRWQLAAEISGALGLLVRGHAARNEPSWAEVRLTVEPGGRGLGGRGSRRAVGNWEGEAPAEPWTCSAGASPSQRRLRVRLLRCRGGVAGGAVELELDEERGVIHEAETNSLRVAPPLAIAAFGRRSSGA